MMDASRRSGRSSQVARHDHAGRAHYNEQSRLAKTIQRDGKTWGAAATTRTLAHANSSMTCYTCHTRGRRAASAATCRCRRTARSRCCTTRGSTTRNWTDYNFQVLRDDIVHARDATARSPATASRRCARPARCWSARRTRSASGSTTCSRRSRRRASAGRRSARSCRTPCGRRRRSSAPTATSRPTATTTRGWPTCCCRARTS